ncbi:MAG TPA: cytochrome d ubiquinol oxidase subunit II [Jatrophihabitans sp.]|jgi:cytochrome d ubiquinol oxidase subunit II
MTQPWQAVVVGIALFATMAAYALFTGADFGGGIWDLLAGGTERGRRPRTAIDASVTPVWEGNQTWIVLGIVLVFTAFPTAFAAIMTSLFVPLSLALLGILLRGIGFAFRHEADRVRTEQSAGALFAASSFLAPFFLGVTVGAVATGRVRTDRTGNVPDAWLNPSALMTGALFVAACAYIGAVYLVGDSHRRGDEGMVRYFSKRALAAGVVTGVFAGINLVFLHNDAPYVFHRLVGAALPLLIVSIVAGATALGLVLIRRVWLLRITAGVAVGAVVAAWGWAQYPYLLPTSLSLREGSAPTASLNAELVVLVMAAVFVVPSFVYLYWLQQHEKLVVTEESGDLVRAVARENKTAARPKRPHRVLEAMVIGAAAWELLREAVARMRRK